MLFSLSLPSVQKSVYNLLPFQGFISIFLFNIYKFIHLFFFFLIEFLKRPFISLAILNFLSLFISFISSILFALLSFCILRQTSSSSRLLVCHPLNVSLFSVCLPLCLHQPSEEVWPFGISTNVPNSEKDWYKLLILSVCVCAQWLNCVS